MAVTACRENNIFTSVPNFFTYLTDNPCCLPQIMQAESLPPTISINCFTNGILLRASSITTEQGSSCVSIIPSASYFPWWLANMTYPPSLGKIFRSIGLRIDPSGMIHQTDRMFIIFITKSFRILLRMSGIITHQRDHPGTMKITGNYIYKTNQFFYHSFSSFSPQSITQASSIPYFDKITNSYFHLAFSSISKYTVSS